MEFPKETIQIANDFLNRMLTFSIALFSIIIAFQKNIQTKFFPIIMLSLIISTTICFLGNFPVEQKYNPNRADTIENAIRVIIKKKKQYIIFSFSLIFLSMCLILLSFFQT